MSSIPYLWLRSPYIELSGSYDRINLVNYYFSDNGKESDRQDLITELNTLKEVNKEPHLNIIRLIGGCSINGITYNFVNLFCY